MRFTIFGTKGYLGSTLTHFLKTQNIECLTPDLKKDGIPKENLGNIIYAIGVPDFKQNPFRAIDAHVLLLNKILNEAKFNSFLYLSSTRLYYNTSSTDENSSLLVNPTNYDYLYNISKIMGETICNISKKPKVRVARLSNVVGKNFGRNVFLTSIMHDAIKTKKIKLETNLHSQKDYIYIEDVLNILPKISLFGKKSIYNIASGENISNKKIIEKIVKITGCKIELIKNARTHSFKPISISQIKKEFDFKPTPVLNKLEEIILEYKNNLK